MLPEIRGVAPTLTDHGPAHVRHVLENIYKLIEGELDYFSPVELYILGLSTLFHDVGNLEGRADHNKRVARHYDHVRNGLQYANEKALIVRIAAAHTGIARNGSANTLADVPPLSHLDGETVKSREVAAIVRFADELAEGPQRTSAYLRERNAYPPDSRLFHEYAAATHLAIDRGNSRIAITYQFALNTEQGVDQELSRLQGFVEYASERIAKLDIERRYARFHCRRPLLPFQNISVRLEVQIDGDFVDPPLEATISDEVNIESEPELLWVRDCSWAPHAVVARISNEVCRRSTNGS